MDVKDLLKEYKFLEKEKSFINQANTAVTADMNQSRIISEFILGKKIKNATTKIITSNEKLATSNEKYTKAMLLLTAGLVFATIVQVFFK